jgi:hypothetical protein
LKRIKQGKRNKVNIEEELQEQMQVGNVVVEIQENQMENETRNNNNKKRRDIQDNESDESVKRRKVIKKGKVEDLIRELKESKQVIEMLEYDKNEESLTRIYKELIEDEIRMKE